jgi:hypothetical protein
MSRISDARMKFSSACFLIAAGRFLITVSPRLCRM